MCVLYTNLYARCVCSLYEHWHENVRTILFLFFRVILADAFRNIQNKIGEIDSVHFIDTFTRSLWDPSVNFISVFVSSTARGDSIPRISSNRECLWAEESDVDYYRH